MNQRAVDRTMSIIMLVVIIVIGLPVAVLAVTGGVIPLFFASVVFAAAIASMVLTFTDTYRKDQP